MNDEDAIARTLNRYSTAASRADWETVLSTYMPDAVWDVPGLPARFEGLEEIRKGLRLFSDPMDYMVQSNSPAIIDVDGDTATAECVIRECGKWSGRDEALEVLGLYVDKLVRTADGWKFTERVFEIRGMHGFPLSPAPAK